jgi:hypothetical protein
MEKWKDKKDLYFPPYVFGSEDGKVECLKININFICLVDKKNEMENVIYINILLCPINRIIGKPFCFSLSLVK